MGGPAHYLGPMILPAILVSAALLITIPPAVHATSCYASYTGSGKTGYYYAYGSMSVSDVYGTLGEVNTEGWTYYSGSNGHSATFLNLIFDDGTNGAHWVQVGVAMGIIDGQNQISREIYFEWDTTGTATVSWVSGYTIPDYDNGEAWDNAWSYSGGSYTFRLAMRSPYYGSTWSTSVNTGSLSYGYVFASTENAYYNNYSGNCNGVNPNTQSHLMYSPSVGNSTWYNWYQCAGEYNNSPYAISGSNCSGQPTYTESGS